MGQDVVDATFSVVPRDQPDGAGTVASQAGGDPSSGPERSLDPPQWLPEGQAPDSAAGAQDAGGGAWRWCA